MLIKIIVIFMIMTFAITELPYFNAKKKDKIPIKC